MHTLYTHWSTLTLAAQEQLANLLKELQILGCVMKYHRGNIKSDKTITIILC